MHEGDHGPGQEHGAHREHLLLSDPPDDDGAQRVAETGEDPERTGTDPHGIGEAHATGEADDHEASDEQSLGDPQRDVEDRAQAEERVERDPVADALVLERSHVAEWIPEHEAAGSHGDRVEDPIDPRQVDDLPDMLQHDAQQDRQRCQGDPEPRSRVGWCGCRDVVRRRHSDRRFERVGP